MKLFLSLAFITFSALTVAAQSDQIAPTFTAFAMDDSRVDTAELRGKIVVLNFWFVNCMNCVEEIRLLNKLVDDYKDKSDVVFLGLATNKKADIEKFLTNNPFRYKILPNAQMIILSKFGTPDKNGEISIPFPMHYVIDREGRVAVKEQGIKGVDKVRSELERQFAGKMTGAK